MKYRGMSGRKPGVHHSARVGGAPESRDFEGEGIEPLIDPTATVSAFCSVDAGTVRPTSVGARSWLLQHVHLGHDVIIGEDVEIATGSVIGGGTWIGDGARIGINATVLPRQVIGAGARIGAGAVVTKDVPAGETWVGNPARPIGSDSTLPLLEQVHEQPPVLTTWIGGALGQAVSGTAASYQ